MKQSITDIKEVVAGDKVWFKGGYGPFAVIHTDPVGEHIAVDLSFIHQSGSIWADNNLFDCAEHTVHEFPTFGDDDHDIHFLVSHDGEHKVVYLRDDNGDENCLLFPTENGSYRWLNDRALIRIHPDWLPLREVKTDD